MRFSMHAWEASRACVLGTVHWGMAFKLEHVRLSFGSLFG